MTQMLHEIAGVVPKEVVILSDQEVVMKLEEEASMMEVSRAVHGLYHWGWAVHNCRLSGSKKRSDNRGSDRMRNRRN